MISSRLLWSRHNSRRSDSAGAGQDAYWLRLRGRRRYRAAAHGLSASPPVPPPSPPRRGHLLTTRLPPSGGVLYWPGNSSTASAAMCSCLRPQHRRFLSQVTAEERGKQEAVEDIGRVMLTPLHAGKGDENGQGDEDDRPPVPDDREEHHASGERDDEDRLVAPSVLKATARELQRHRLASWPSSRRCPLHDPRPHCGRAQPRPAAHNRKLCRQRCTLGRPMLQDASGVSAMRREPKTPLTCMRHSGMG